MNRISDLIRAVTFAPRQATSIVCTVLMVVLWIMTTVEGASYYTSPSGSGSTCSQNNPCSVSIGLSKAVSGDKLVLQDGVYDNLRFDTQSPGVTIQAEHKHAAIIRNGYSSHLIGIKHANTTLRGLRIDGLKTAGGPHGVIRFYTSSNVLIEHNLIENTGGTSISVGGSVHTATISDVILRHNITRDIGFTHPGEAFYIGSSKPEMGGSTTNVQVYGNTATRFTQQAIDLKPSSINADVHHNILQGQLYRPIPQKTGVESTLVIRNKSHRVHDNIMRDISDAGNAVFWVDATHNHQAFRNVINNVAKTGKAIATRGPGPGGAPSEIYNNTFCGLSTYSVSAEYGLKVYSNNGIPGGVPQSACDAEIKRILHEMNGLPGLSYDGSTPSISPPRTLKIVNGN